MAYTENRQFFRFIVQISAFKAVSHCFILPVKVAVKKVCRNSSMIFCQSPNFFGRIVNYAFHLCFTYDFHNGKSRINYYFLDRSSASSLSEFIPFGTVKNLFHKLRLDRNKY